MQRCSGALFGFVVDSTNAEAVFVTLHLGPCRDNGKEHHQMAAVGSRGVSWYGVPWTSVNKMVGYCISRCTQRFFKFDRNDPFILAICEW